ncbi:unnamed protein product, partial [Choristocarpus tenellus]
ASRPRHACQVEEGRPKGTHLGTGIQCIHGCRRRFVGWRTESYLREGFQIPEKDEWPHWISGTSYAADAYIEHGEVDEELLKTIEPALKVLGGVVETIDTTNNVFTFKYKGHIRHQVGIEAYARMLIQEILPDYDAKMVTYRKRDNRDH